MGLEEEVENVLKKQDINKEIKPKHSQEVPDLGKGHISTYDGKGRLVTEGAKGDFIDGQILNK